MRPDQPRHGMAGGKIFVGREAGKMTEGMVLEQVEVQRMRASDPATQRRESRTPQRTRRIESSLVSLKLGDFEVIGCALDSSHDACGAIFFEMPKMAQIEIPTLCCFFHVADELRRHGDLLD